MKSSTLALVFIALFGLTICNFNVSKDCIASIEKLALDTIDLQKAIVSKNFIKIATLSAKVILDGKKVDTDCKSTIEIQVEDQITDLKACLQKVEVLLDDLEAIQQDYKNNKFINLIKDIIGALPHIKDTEDICSKIIPHN